MKIIIGIILKKIPNLVIYNQVLKLRDFIEITTEFPYFPLENVGSVRKYSFVVRG